MQKKNVTNEIQKNLLLDLELTSKRTLLCLPLASYQHQPRNITPEGIKVKPAILSKSFAGGNFHDGTLDDVANCFE